MLDLLRLLRLWKANTDAASILFYIFAFIHNLDQSCLQIALWHRCGDPTGWDHFCVNFNLQMVLAILFLFFLFFSTWYKADVLKGLLAPSLELFRSARNGLRILSSSYHIHGQVIDGAWNWQSLEPATTLQRLQSNDLFLDLTFSLFRLSGWFGSAERVVCPDTISTAHDSMDSWLCPY